ncbi:MAG: TonB-dependent receptor, partial [Leptolyngbya sp. SIO4C5]|nr:TonB-dependent receptor [Leptolyngbya sp. SIO4C5]
MNNLHRIFWLTGLFAVVLAPVARAETSEVVVVTPTGETATADLTNAADVVPATTVEEWVSQMEAQEAAAIPTELAQALIQITGVNVSTDGDRLELILEANGELATPETSIVGDALTADIPNAVLNLPEGKTFEQFSPAEGIALVSVRNRPDGGVRVSITGTDAPPQAQVSTEAGNLVLSVVPGVTTATDAAAEDAIQVVVTATRTEEDPLDVPRSVTIIDRQQIEAQSAVSDNTADIVSRFVPGFGAPNRSNRANAQSLRGREFSVLIDGVPQRSNRSPNVQLEYIDPNNVERIEVVSGPTAIYGAEALGGVINIITRRSSEERLLSTAEIGFNNLAIGEENGIGYDLRYQLSGRRNDADFLLSLDHRTTGDFYDAEGDLIPTDNRTLDNTESLGILAKLGVDLDEQQRLELNFTYNSDDRDVEILPVTNSDPDGKTLATRRTIEFASGSTDPEIRSLSTYLTYTHDDLFLNSEVDLNFYYRNSFQSGIPDDARGDGFFDTVVLTSATEEAFGGQLQIDTPLASRADLLWGVDFELQRNGASVTEEADPTDFDQRGIFRTVNSYDNLVPEYHLDSLGIFGQLQWDITDSFLVSGGVRYDRFTFSVDDYETFYDDDFDRFFDPGFNEAEARIEGGSRTFDSTVFNLGTVYKFTPELGVFANFSQGFSVPTFLSFLGFPPVPSTFTIDGSIDDLQPQKVNQYELGIRGHWDTVQFSLAGFYNTSELGARLVEDERGILTLQRAPERIYGVEASVDWQPSDRWQLGTVVGWNEGESDPNDDGDFQPISSFDIQPLKLAAYVQHETLPGWNNRLQLLYVGDRDRAAETLNDRGRPIDPEPIEGYIVVDYITSIDLWEGTLQLGVHN